jgi:hypothetical protein
MTVYIVISNSEVNGEIDGVFFKYEDAKAKFNEMKADWLKWAEGDEYDYEDDDDYFSITNLTSDEFSEISIEAKEVL